MGVGVFDCLGGVDLIIGYGVGMGILLIENLKCFMFGESWNLNWLIVYYKGIE